MAQSTIRDAEIEELLDDYSAPIFRAAGLQPGAVDIYLINDPSVNAFVAGGQKMFIHTGLILDADTPNELIGVIAHETGHIAGGHLARSRDAMSNASVPAYLGAAIGLGLMVAGMPQAGLAVMMGGQHVALREYLAYSRVQEASADQAGISYLNETHQSGRGMVAFFERFRDQDAMISTDQDPFIRSHPLSSDRVALLEQRVNQSPYVDAQDSPESIHRLNMAKAKIRGFLEPVSVVFRRFPESDTSDEARYARAVAYFRQGQTNLALAQIDPLIQKEPDNPYFYELRGQILLEGGRVDDAIPEYRRSIELRPDSALLRINLGQALLASEEDHGNTSTNQEALQNLQFAVAHDDTSSFAWHQLAIAYSRAGNEGMADLSIAEQYYMVRDMDQAREFAARARDKLPEDTVHWNRAMDILFLTDPSRRDNDSGQ
jgi:predicted Zn-dependent protease